jgi:TPR repeat protein
MQNAEFKEGLNKDMKKFVHHLKKALEIGNADAQYTMGTILVHGEPELGIKNSDDR